MQESIMPRYPEVSRQVVGWLKKLLPLSAAVSAVALVGVAVWIGALAIRAVAPAAMIPIVAPGAALVAGAVANVDAPDATLCHFELLESSGMAATTRQRERLFDEKRTSRVVCWLKTIQSLNDLVNTVVGL